MRRPALSIRTKVLLVSTLLLAIPYVGYQYVREMETYLREGLESSLLGAAQALAGALHDRTDLLASMSEPDDGAGTEVYAHALRQPIEIDAYTTDWGAYLERPRRLGAANVAYGEADPASLSVDLVAGKHGAYLYLLVLVRDDRVIYASPRPEELGRSDHVRIVTGGDDSGERTYLLATISPGWVTAYRVDPSRRQSGDAVRSEGRIRAEWRETDEGYLVEARIPLNLLGPRLAIEVADADGPQHGPPQRVLSTAAAGERRIVGRLLLPSTDIENLIKSLGRQPGRRIWVLDRRGRVIARGGTLERDEPLAPVNPLVALVLSPPSAELLAEEPVAARLTGPEIEAALGGQARTHWRAMRHPGSFVVSAAYPVWQDETVAGAVVVEESSLGILTVRRQAIANLFNKTLLVFGAGAVILLAFATRLSSRLIKLRDETDRAIDEHGRVVGRLSGSRARDEIGDLGRSFSAMMDRLREYNHYLEQLARRLSHELRTPIAVLRSSLDALQMDDREETRDVYLDRARNGIDRLSTIISRMSEAARLEQSLESADVEPFDLARVAGAAVTAYRTAWPDLVFELRAPDGGCTMRGVPDLIVQLLDKLVANAMDFCRDDTPIVVSVTRRGSRLRLEVENRGPTLPEAMQAKLFESLVSLRDGGDKSQPHLGLGLYIVRLIAEFHSGSASAVNRADGDGVTMRVDFPAT